MSHSKSWIQLGKNFHADEQVLCLKPGDDRHLRSGRNVGGVYFHPRVFVLGEIYKTLCFKIQGLTCAMPPLSHPLQSCLSL